ncbi:hypothetical protein GDO81_009631 [Engystomops pustulosus]|uniref:Uncharacterized protein n=1 Tax=Engystomops pustulosus TaxID=76066 RepID=A0AAV7BTN4_ENGPU|nr:hypothetical protein GDO81_009631 [Engystomops pustulosus]
MTGEGGIQICELCSSKSPSAMRAYSAVLVCQQQILQIYSTGEWRGFRGMILIDCDRTNSGSVTKKHYLTCFKESALTPLDLCQSEKMFNIKTMKPHY